MTVSGSQRPDSVTLAGFVGVILLGGSNFVAVRFSNRGLPPFYGAAIRFLAASILLFGFMAFRRIPFLERAEWKATLAYGVLNFAAFYAFAYWALLSLPSGVAAVIAASVPLLTLLLAVAHRVESFTMRGLVGAAMAIAGIALMVGVPSDSRLSIGALFAMVGAALSAAEAAVIIKRLPIGHPVTTNGVAMLAGSVLLFSLSRVSGESWSTSMEPVTLAALTHLVLLGSVGLFVLYLFTLGRWTASGVSYVFVLMPIVASLLGAWLLKEAISAGVVIGGLIILLGVYVGALSGRRVPAPDPDGAKLHEA